MNTNASVFYMEPYLEEWPTSNGNYASSCGYLSSMKGVCEFLNPARLLGRGNYSTCPITHPLPTLRVSNLILDRLYPGFFFRATSEHCQPSCLPATWRTDMARAILAVTENAVSVVPIFWQLHAKGSPSNRNQGDCIHKSLDAVLLFNEQMARIMMERIPGRLLKSPTGTTPPPHLPIPSPQP
jgi:hypothetical protein